MRTTYRLDLDWVAGILVILACFGSYMIPSIPNDKWIYLILGFLIIGFKIIKEEE